MNQSFTQDVDPILYLPCSTPEFERGIWEAVTEGPGRDWTDTEREYLRRNDGIRESLADWAEFMSCTHCWTGANLKFLSEWGNADEMDTPSADPNPKTQVNESKD